MIHAYDQMRKAITLSPETKRIRVGRKPFQLALLFVIVGTCQKEFKRVENPREWKRIGTEDTEVDKNYSGTFLIVLSFKQNQGEPSKFCSGG
ncbi:hypothetical protein JTB14_015082 [Gonioctena quinquepunctata]|nr:hypothetical protein JTB14_015082 [Gonioctena quinquepunctata]